MKLILSILWRFVEKSINQSNHQSIHELINHFLTAIINKRNNISLGAYLHKFCTYLHKILCSMQKQEHNSLLLNYCFASYKVNQIQGP
jgi:hypothetical protein